jgi:hypothetical protein
MDLDDTWIEIIGNSNIDSPSKEKEEELQFNGGNMVRANWFSVEEHYTRIFAYK